MSFLSRLFGKRPDDRAMVRPLWHRVVELSRDPRWYVQYGVADNVPGRFDAITAILSLVLIRMEREQELMEPSARLTEIFVDDMDGQLRESGVGDIVVGKRIGKLMGVLGGRLGAYRDALPLQSDIKSGKAQLDEHALIGAVSRNITLVEGADARALALALKDLAVTLEDLTAYEILEAKIPL